MLRPRIIPCLLVSRGGLVKTMRFDAPTYVGDPINAVKIFNEKETDELVVLDIDATANRAEPDLRMITNLAAECRMPLCYGGGITRAHQAKRIINLGVEKVALSSAAIADPNLISRTAEEIGAQSVVVVLDVRQGPRGYEVWTHNGRVATGRSPLDLAQEAEARGAGEIVVNTIDRDGCGVGYDLDLAKAIRQAVALPMTMLGGAGSLEHLGRLFQACGVVGASAGSLFVFKGPRRAVLISYPDQGTKDALLQASLAPASPWP